MTNGIDRESVRLAFEAENMESRPLRKPKYLQPFFEKQPYFGNIIAENLFEIGLCLPSGSNLKDEERLKIKNETIVYLNLIKFFIWR